MQELYSFSETVTKVYRNGDAASRFDDRQDAGHAVMFLDDARFLFHLRKDDREKVIVIRIIFAERPIKGSAATSVIGMARRRANGCCRATATQTRS